jgi:hypothetical protein
VLETNGMLSQSLGGSFDVNHEVMVTSPRNAKPHVASNLALDSSNACTASGGDAMELLRLSIIGRAMLVAKAGLCDEIGKERRVKP